jgi:hypothetical protein
MQTFRLRSANFCAVFKLVDDLRCQLFHGKWARVVSYSRQGAWRCTKPGCAAETRHNRELFSARQNVTVTELRPTQAERSGRVA